MATSEVIAPVRRVLAARELRRVHVAFLAFSLSEHATWLAILFYALTRGGPAEVGLVAVLQLLPGVLSTPFSAYAGDRYDPRRAMAVGYAVQSLTMAATAVAMAKDAWLPAYLFAAAAATAICFTRPVMGSLLPDVTRSPSDLVAANVVVGLIEQVGVFVGPIGAGAMMALWSPAAVFVGGAVLTGLGCLAVLTIGGDRADRTVAPLQARDAVRELFRGFGALRTSKVIRVFLTFLACAGLIKGVADVVFVTFADIRLDGTAGQAGVLAGAYGLGGLAGAASVTGLIRGRRVDRQLVVVVGVMSFGLVVLAAASAMPSAVLGFALLGSAESALALTSTVSIQRVARTDVLARVFGIVEAVQMGCIALGSLAITLLVSSGSLGRSFVLLAGFLAVVVLIGVLAVRRHTDDLQPVDQRIVQRLLADPLFEALPAPTIERLARSTVQHTASAGTTLIAEGDTGDRFHLLVRGEVAITKQSVLVRTLRDGGSFGELALLSDAPRAATVTTTTDVVVLTLAREPFLEAVTGHSRSLAAANRVRESYS